MITLDNTKTTPAQNRKGSTTGHQGAEASATGSISCGERSGNAPAGGVVADVALIAISIGLRMVMMHSGSRNDSTAVPTSTIRLNLWKVSFFRRKR